MHADRVDDELRIRVLFAAEADTEREVRQRIERALSGQWQFPEGFTNPWQLRESRPGELSSEDTSQAERLIRG